MCGVRDATRCKIILLFVVFPLPFFAFLPFCLLAFGAPPAAPLCFALGLWFCPVLSFFCHFLAESFASSSAKSFAESFVKAFDQPIAKSFAKSFAESLAESFDKSSDQI